MNRSQLKRLKEAQQVIAELLEQEEEKVDNMAENFSDTQRFEKMEDIVADLDEANRILDELIWKVEE